MAASVPAGARVVALNDLHHPAADHRGGDRDRAELAHRPGLTAADRRRLRREHLHPDGARACGRSPSSMSSSHGGTAARPATTPSAGHAATGPWPRSSFDATEAPMSEESGGLRGRHPRRRHRQAHALRHRAERRSTPPTQQIADWGAPLGPGDTLDLRIAQLSALLGRGHRARRHADLLRSDHGRRNPEPAAALPDRLARRRSTSPTTRRCGCSTGSPSSRSRIGTWPRRRARRRRAPAGSSAPARRGEWAGWDGDVAMWADGAWLRLPARTGWRAWVDRRGAARRPRARRLGGAGRRRWRTRAGCRRRGRAGGRHHRPGGGRGAALRPRRCLASTRAS